MLHGESPAPGDVGALAYTRGTEIHFAPGAYISNNSSAPNPQAARGWSRGGEDVHRELPRLRTKIGPADHCDLAEDSRVAQARQSREAACLITGRQVGTELLTSGVVGESDQQVERAAIICLRCFSEVRRRAPPSGVAGHCNFVLRVVAPTASTAWLQHDPKVLTRALMVDRSKHELALVDYHAICGAGDRHVHPPAGRMYERSGDENERTNKDGR